MSEELCGISAVLPWMFLTPTLPLFSSLDSFTPPIFMLLLLLLL